MDFTLRGTDNETYVIAVLCVGDEESNGVSQLNETRRITKDMGKGEEGARA